jgi:hypothetical protein
VDETGPFDDASEEVAVAGLLVSGESPAGHGAVLRAALEKLPYVRWPYHAAYLERPIFHLLSAEAAWKRRQSFDFPLSSERVSGALEDLRQRAAEPLREARKALREGKEPSVGHLTQLNHPLKKVLTRAEHDKLIAEVDAANVLVARTLAAIERRSGGIPGAVAFAAGEAVMGDASLGVDPSSDGGTKRYGTLLLVLFERVAQALGRLGGETEVSMNVLSRPIRRRGVRGNLQLGVEHVTDIASMVEVPESVRLIPARTEIYAEVQSGGPVLADAVANRCGRVLRHARAKDFPLGEVERRLIDVLRIPVRLGEPPLPNVAACGAARALVRGGPEEMLGRARPPAAVLWSWEQAVEWAAHATSAGHS